jgi:hypothetical protein
MLTGGEDIADRRRDRQPRNLAPISAGMVLRDRRSQAADHRTGASMAIYGRKRTELMINVGRGGGI